MDIPVEGLGIKRHQGVEGEGHSAAETAKKFLKDIEAKHLLLSASTLGFASIFAYFGESSIASFGAQDMSRGLLEAVAAAGSVSGAVGSIAEELRDSYKVRK